MERGKDATGLTLDQYIRRYAVLQKVLSFNQWKLSQYDNNNDGTITKKDFSDKGWREYSKLSTDDFNKGYAEYLDTVEKANAYAKREAAAQWRSANGVETDETDLTTLAQEREGNRQKTELFNFGMSAGRIALIVGVVIAAVLLFKKK